ncbi:YadA-like family protein [Escherichia coli]|nr:YadA-like family protein [Escherichia coli]HBQ4491325.1 YadA-like family protein [Escherichia coli]
MSKKFSKTILSSAVAGLLMMSSGAMAADPQIIKVGDGQQYQVRLYNNGEVADIYDVVKKEVYIGAINTINGSMMTYNQQEFTTGGEAILKDATVNGGVTQQTLDKVNAYLNSISYPVDSDLLLLDNLSSGSLTVTDITELKNKQNEISKSITSANKDVYVEAVRSGGNSDAAIAAAKDGPGVLQEYNRIVTNIDQLNKDTTFAMDADGNITLDEAAGTGERYGVKDVVAEVVEDTTVRVAEDGSLTTARNTQTTKRVNEAVVDLDKSVRTNSQDIATNRKAIQSNSRQLQEHNARLNDHQRQIRENHEEMKRAAAQSAALAGLFQPYSVGKFNATAALGGYSDKQAVAVGVGYRFSEQTAAKAGIAASDGDVSYNVGVNFEF